MLAAAPDSAPAAAIVPDRRRLPARSAPARFSSLGDDEWTPADEWRADVVSSDAGRDGLRPRRTHRIARLAPRCSRRPWRRRGPAAGGSPCWRRGRHGGRRGRAYGFARPSGSSVARVRAAASGTAQRRGAARAAVAAPQLRPRRHVHRHGLVQNPAGGGPSASVIAVVYLFDQDGRYFAGGNAPLDVTALSAGRRVAVRRPGAGGRPRQPISRRFPQPRRPRRRPRGPPRADARRHDRRHAVRQQPGADDPSDRGRRACRDRPAPRPPRRRRPRAVGLASRPVVRGRSRRSVPSARASRSRPASSS